MFFATVLALFSIIVIGKCVVVVPAGHAYVVERLGRYLRTLPPGPHLLLPFLDVVRFRYSTDPTEEEISDSAITLDNVPVQVTTAFRWSIADAHRAGYASADPAASLKTLVQTLQRQWIGERRFDDVRETTRELQIAIARGAADAAKQWGLSLHEVDVRRIARLAA